MPWRVEILDDIVLSEVEGWPLKVRASLDRIIERIETLGLERVHPPFVKHLQGKLWEMRPGAAGIEGRAVDVAVSGQRIVIVAAFVKKSRKTPKRWLDLALHRAGGIP